MVNSPIEVRLNYISNSIAKGGAFVNYHNWFYLCINGVYTTRDYNLLICRIRHFRATIKIDPQAESISELFRNDSKKAKEVFLRQICLEAELGFLKYDSTNRLSFSPIVERANLRALLSRGEFSTEFIML